MAEIFLSYSRNDSESILRFVSCLQKEGFSVWFDAQLRSGTTFPEEITRELENCKCVLVVWSQNSINSRWVNAEAYYGWETQKIVSCKIDTCEVQAPFFNLHHADLVNWNGWCEADEWRVFINDIRSVYEGNVLQRKITKVRDPGEISFFKEGELPALSSNASHKEIMQYNDLFGDDDFRKTALSLFLYYESIGFPEAVKERALQEFIIGFNAKTKNYRKHLSNGMRFVMSASAFLVLHTILYITTGNLYVPFLIFTSFIVVLAVPYNSWELSSMEKKIEEDYPGAFNYLKRRSLL